MSPVTAVALVALIVAAFSVLCCAALKRRLVELEYEVRGGIGTSLQATRAVGVNVPGPAVILKTDFRCLSCRDVMLAFAEGAAGDFDRTYVAITDSSEARPLLDEFRAIGAPVEVVADATLYASLGIPWIPGLILVDSARTIVDSAPAGSRQGVESFLTHAREVAA